MELKNIHDMREEIDRIDGELLRLMCERAVLAMEVGRLKKSGGLSVFDPSREQQVIDHLMQQNRGPLPDAALRHVFTEIISACRALQEPLRVCFLGPEGTFTHQASLAYFGRSCQFVPCDSIGDAFRQVERGKAHFGVVPIENSTEGAVGASLDELAMSELTICGEVVLRISHAIMSIEDDLSAIEVVLAHPQALAQCQGWLAKNLPGRALVPASSTAAAAQQAAQLPGTAAIGSPMLADNHDLKILAEEIQDLPLNLTRFLVLGTGSAPQTGADKTSLFFSTPHNPGALRAALGPFAEQGINLNRIESRPSKQAPWEYLFFVDIDGHVCEIPVRKAIDALSARTTRLRVLGSYPVAGAHSSSGLVPGQAFEPAMDRRQGGPKKMSGTEAPPTAAPTGSSPLNTVGVGDPADPQIDRKCCAHSPCADVSAEGL